MSEIQRRVKVFSFGDSNTWEEIGMGFVTRDYTDVTRGDVLLTITVRSEYDNSIILQSKVLPDRSYKIQEGTMIVWTENETCDIALSFQEKAACDELWLKICEAQGLGADDSDLLDRFDDSWSISELPPCELSRLSDILSLIVSVAPFPQRREVLVLMIEKESYVSQLLDLFRICEDLENIDGLHHLYDIFKALFMFNSASLLQVLFRDEYMMDVIGCMEYNPKKATPTRHREYLAKSSEFKEVIKFSDPKLLPMIHQTYKVQYIQEVILPTPSLFEENMMSALNSIILFNKADIIRMIGKDEPFLRELFQQLCLEETPEGKFRQLVALLKEICVFSLALENEDRTKLFLSLQEFGFMSAMEGMLMFEDLVVVSTGVDILNLIAEFNSAILWEYTLNTKDTTHEDTQLLNIIISLLVDGEFVDIDVQLVNLIKAIISPENLTVETATQTSDKPLFLKYFYNHCMPRLLAPLMAQTSADKISKDTSQNAVILSHILDILSLCVRIHTVQVRNYIIDKNILGRVLVLMMSSHSHLVLAALRLCRRIVGLKDEFYNGYIICKNLFNPIVKAFMASDHRYNLVNSAILELFNFIRIEKVVSLINYVVENFWSTLETVKYVDTFEKLKLKHEQEKDAKLNASVKGNVIIKSYKVNVSMEDELHSRRDPRQLDKDEEAWFDEEEEEFIPFGTNLSSTTPTDSTSLAPTDRKTPYGSITTTPPPLSSSLTSSPISDYSKFVSSLKPRTMADSSATLSTGITTQGSYSPRPFTVGARLQMMERNRATTMASYSMPTITSALQSLVDYDEDSDEEATETSVETEETEVATTASKETSTTASTTSSTTSTTTTDRDTLQNAHTKTVSTATSEASTSTGGKGLSRATEDTSTGSKTTFEAGENKSTATLAGTESQSQAAIKEKTPLSASAENSSITSKTTKEARVEALPSTEEVLSGVESSEVKGHVADGEDNGEGVVNNDLNREANGEEGVVVDNGVFNSAPGGEESASDKVGGAKGDSDDSEEKPSAAKRLKMSTS